MLIGYNLLSQDSEYRNPERANILATEQLTSAGCQIIYTQKDKAFSSLARGDTFVIPRLKVLAKSRLVFVQTFNLLEKKGVHLQSLDEDLFLPCDSMVSEGWELINKIFPKNAKSSSSKKKKKDPGRPPTEEDTIELIKILKKDRRMFKKNSGNLNIVKVSKVAGISRQTYYKYFPKQA